MTLRDEAVKGHARQEPQVAGTTQILQTSLLHLSGFAPAGNYPPKVRMTRSCIKTEVAGSMTDGADTAVWWTSVR